ncbi:MAG TPA: hypothetical protein VLG09_06025, partial [Candidatus Saccharimonadales bacterium]|nr:hypothetical protein [Candidatus Saccharimonadales bacterium]
IMAQQLLDPKDRHKSYNPGDNRAADLFPGPDDVSRGLAELEEHANDPANHAAEPSSSRGNDGEGLDKKTSDPDKNISQARQLEKDSPWTNNFKGGPDAAAKKSPITLKGVFKKKGPMGVIIALLGGGGLAVTSLSPGLLLVELKTIFTNDRDDSAPAIQINAETMIQTKLKSIKAKVGICGERMSIRCRWGSVSNAQLNTFKEKGFKIETEKKFGRNIIKSFAMPDGTRVNDPAEMKALMKDPKYAAFLSTVFSTATPYLSTFFNAVLNKLGLSKLAKITGDTKEKINESIKTHLGTDADGKPTKLAAFGEKAKGLADKAGKAVGIEMGCLAYNLSRGIVTGIKIAKGATAMAFSLMFLNEADQLIAGDSDPAVVGALSDRLTQTNTDPKDPTYGLSATDAPAFKTALYGDSNALPEYALAYVAGGGVLAKSLSAGVNFVNTITGSKRVTKIICKAAKGAGLLSCIGMPVGCGVMLALGPTVVEPVLGKIVKEAIDQGSKIKITATEPIGAKAGELLGVGAGLLLAHKSSALGMKPASSGAEIGKYQAYTDEIRQQNIATEKYMAKADPFNIYNQYSFLGSLAHNLNLAAFSSASIGSNITQLFGTIPSALNSMVSNAGAADGVFMKMLPYNPDRYNHCDDDALKEAGIVGDMDCGVRFVLSAKELTMDVDANLDYMINNDHVDDGDATGTAKSDDYKKFMEFCGPQREDPYGETSKPIEDGDLDDDDWYTGKKCAEDSTEMSNFRVFTMRNAV